MFLEMNFTLRDYTVTFENKGGIFSIDVIDSSAAPAKSQATKLAETRFPDSEIKFKALRLTANKG